MASGLISTSEIIGLGGYLPKKVVTNLDLEKTIDTSDEWIRTRTGILQRHIAAEDENVSDMGYEAALLAIKDSGIDAKDIDLIIFSTNTPDNSFPSSANQLHAKLGIKKKIPSFDMQAICSGFLYGLSVADSMIASGRYKTILLVASDKMSSLVDWNDRRTSVLFGDGAGAVILRATESDEENASKIIDCEIFSDGNQFDILFTDGGIGSTKSAGTVQMKGPEVFKNAVNRMVESTRDILRKHNFTTIDIDLFVPHQANLRIINAVAAKFDIDDEKVVKTVSMQANTSAATIPLALFQMQKEGKLKKGQLIAMTSFGAGATWGAALVRW